MSSELIALSEKVDLLSRQLASQQELLLNSPNGTELTALNVKLDRVLGHLDEQKQRQQDQQELKEDLLPIANHMIKLTIDELAEIGTEFQLEDLLFLVKRLLRDTHMLVGMLDRLQSTVELLDETKLLGTQVFNQAVLQLDDMERKGYFRFAKEGAAILENIIAEFDEEDVKALGENIVSILRTVRNLTQPEIMNLTNNALDAIRVDPIPDEVPSALGLVREMSDPQVRRGFARLLNLVKSLADQPIPTN